MWGGAPAPKGVGLRDLVLAALAGCVSDDAESPETAALLERAQAVGHGGPWMNQVRGAGRADPRDEPLAQLTTALQLTDLERLVVALLLAVDDEPLVARIVAQLQGPRAGSRPTLALLGETFREAIAPRGSIQALLSGAAAASGLIVTVDADGIGTNPLGDRRLAIPVPLSLALRGLQADWPTGSTEEVSIPLPASVEKSAAQWARALGEGSRGATLLIRTPSATEGRAVAGAVARSLGRTPLFLMGGDDQQGLGPWLVLRNQLPVWSYDLAPGDRTQLPCPRGYRGPIVVVAGSDGMIQVDDGPPLEWRLAPPTANEREELWSAALGEESALARELGKRYRLGAGRISALGRQARRLARFDGADAAPTFGHVETAGWSDEDGLGRFAQPIRDRIPAEALVAGPILRAELDRLLLRCRARDGLDEGLGVSLRARYHPGVKALFVGPSGTGKTLAAGWLATRLGLPLYRVDLAAITSKYIGDTEKNLAQLLAAAENAGVVLLFDEADSVFGKRTDIRDANDRFANAQTNYLLQRIELFDGIVLLTSNSRDRFDVAMLRRTDTIIEFPLPDRGERLALWNGHLGAGHRVSEESIEKLAAVASDLTGGHIRQVVLTAALLARGRGEAISYADVMAGLVSEYRKIGRAFPFELTRDK